MKVVLLTHTAISIRTLRGCIPGGLIASVPGKKNAGWRIDYFLVSADMESRLAGAKIYTDVFGSDHCPVELDLK